MRGRTTGEEDRERGWARDDGSLVLALSDLIADRDGEVVLFNDSRLPVLTLETDQRPVARGVVEAHVTASGVDVAGYNYVTFGNGLTLYYPRDMQLVLVSERG
ncbi:MAG TPA: hypothetical protein ENJ38_01185 [Rhodospirillales bacterium]|nr:hypothetical protein [Rhodospirillales bacterium]